MSTLTAQLTAEEFARQYANVPFCELVRGEVIESTASGLRHSRITMRAAMLLEAWSQASGRGRVFVGDAGLLTERDPDTVRGADAAFFSFQRLPADKEPVGFSSVPAELVIEVVGQGQGWDAMVEKTGEYLGMGVNRVWLLSPESETVHVFGGNAKPRELHGDDVLADEELLPGLSCRAWQFFHDRQPDRP